MLPKAVCKPSGPDFSEANLVIFPDAVAQYRSCCHCRASIEAMAQGNLLAKLHFEQFNACQTSHYSDAVPPMVVAGRGIVCRPSRAARKDYDH